MKGVVQSIVNHFDLRRHGVNPDVFSLHRGVTDHNRDVQVIVSLTSHPGRIDKAHLTIRTIINQTYKPDHIILWLADEQFPDGESSLPKQLLRLRKNGLEIRWTKDTNSYKKLLPSLKEFPEAIIITFDDDWYYRCDLVQNLMIEHKNHPNEIISNLVTRPILDASGCVIGNKEYDESLGTCDYLNKQVGSDGVLYPPHSLDNEVFSEEFFKLAPTNDDIWFWTMAVKNKTRIFCPKNPTRAYAMTAPAIQNKTSLSEYNSENNTYTLCMRSIFEEYPEVLRILNAEETEAVL